MPKAYDVKHNYYADLELPTSATVEEVKKQYRKLALLYHPDRNAGKEEEFIPKFQAIQAAHEILGDPPQKNKYDADRRKAGLYPGTSSVGGGAPRGNPYQAASAYPPPPRRTQPGTWQRPGASAGAPPTGADRFTNFPRQTPTAKRADPAAERQNAFQAWQNMNTAQGRQGQPPPQHTRFPSGGPPPTPRRPQPPPRQDTKFPTDEKIRAGFNYREPPSSSHSTDRAEERQSAWAAFSQSHASKPGVGRSNTTRAPKKQGFDPNVPGSDERPAPDNAYVHRHKSEDLGQPGSVPPPPPGPPPSQPSTPGSPTAKRPFADPLRPFKSRTDEDTPYSEGNRQRTPYSSSFTGERTDFSSNMRRSNSTRDNTKLNPETASSRARSTSPLSRNAKSQTSQRKQAFTTGSSSSSSAENSDPEMTNTPEQYQSPFTHPDKPKVAPQNRPKKVPSPPSKRFNGSTDPTSPPATDGAASEGQKGTSNMYVSDDISSCSPPQHPPFSPRQWRAQSFGLPATQRKASVPKWAIPASVLPVRKTSADKTIKQDGFNSLPGQREVTDLIARDRSLAAASENEQRAYFHLRTDLGLAYGPLPDALDMGTFMVLVTNARNGGTTGHELLDRALLRTLTTYPSVGHFTLQNQHANDGNRSDSFSFPISPDTFSPTVNGKARSEESINTKFSADGWSGTFAGSGDYFAPPSANTRRNSPATRNGSRPGVRSATSNYPQSPSTGNYDGASMPPPPRPTATDGSTPGPPSAGSEAKFSKEQWEETFKDGSWTWPPPPPKPPGSEAKPTSKSRGPSRKGSRNGAKSPPTSAGTAANPHVVDEEDDETIDPQNVNGRQFHEPEMMDIDQDQPAAHQPMQGKEPRMVSVPPSAWRQNHDNPSHRRTASNDTAHLNTSLDDLANVAPFNTTRSPDTGLKNMSTLSSTLPFASQASSTLPTHPLKPSTLQTPIVPVPPKAPARLTKSNWHTFAQNFSLYLRAFHSFNTTLLQHFTAREERAQARMQNGLQWLEATGDTVASPNGAGSTEGMLTGPSGWGSYLQGVKEDERVREVWGLGCERHREAVRGFEEVRERVRRLVVGGGLQ